VIHGEAIGKNMTRPYALQWRRHILLIILLLPVAFFVLHPLPGTVNRASCRAETTCETPGGMECHALGVYFYRLEPSFYTGFAPRSQDPRRIHIHLGRGNQVRVTLVLSDRMIHHYLADLAFRYHTYTRLIEKGRLVLTQNRAYEVFKRTIMKEGILDKAEKQPHMDPAEYHRMSLEILKRLNPDRLFHITIDFKTRIRDWAKQLHDIKKGSLSKSASLDLINSLLPTRLYVTELEPGLKKDLIRLIDLYRDHPEKDAESWNHFYQEAGRFFTAVSQGLYPLRDDRLEFYEFTAIYPVGTYNDTTTYHGMTIPLYPYPGKWRIHIHQRTRVADHISDAACYGYLPWIPYMHVGERLHNSFHSLWFNIDTRKTAFIPEKWRHHTHQSREEGPYPYLWLLSRGPMSHGCTHINAGHISELRQILPSSEKVFLEVETFRNKSYHFDVFDIYGNGRPQVMGVEYFHAYQLKDKKPYRMRASSDRRSFYAWMYQKGYRIKTDGRVIFDQAPTTKFIGRKPADGKTYHQIPLYEAKYAKETIQFYKPVSIPFTRELRRVHIDYRTDPRILKPGNE